MGYLLHFQQDRSKPDSRIAIAAGIEKSLIEGYEHDIHARIWPALLLQLLLMVDPVLVPHRENILLGVVIAAGEEPFQFCLETLRPIEFPFACLLILYQFLIRLRPFLLLG